MQASRWSSLALFVVLLAPAATAQTNDTAVATGCIAGGMLLGGLYAIRHVAELGGGELSVTPQRIGADGRTRYDVGMRFSV